MTLPAQLGQLKTGGTAGKREKVERDCLEVISGARTTLSAYRLE